jgi:C1A family cysteine protease
MHVYNSFDDLYDSGNTIKMPEKNEALLGAHAMTFVGYDLNKKLFLVRNSFGKYWGLNGYCYMPFEYMRNEVMDCWIFDIDIDNSLPKNSRQQRQFIL